MTDMNVFLFLALSPRKFSLWEDDLLQTVRAKGVVMCILYMCTSILTPVVPYYINVETK